MGVGDGESGEENGTCAGDVGWDDEGEIDGRCGHADNRSGAVTAEEGGNVSLDATGVTVLSEFLKKRIGGTGFEDFDRQVDVGERVVPVHGVREARADLGVFPKGTALGLVAHHVVFEGVGAQNAELLAE